MKLTKQDIDCLKTLPEYKIYSQLGEEGILLNILNFIGITNEYLVDIGAGCYDSGISNSRLLFESGWNGLAFDMNDAEDSRIIKAFVTPNNIVQLLKDNNCPKEFDFLNLDLDSFDYDILYNILNEYKPRVVCSEWNATLPIDIPVKLKYEEGYTWDNTNKYGYSFSAGVSLFMRQGYVVIFNQCNTNLFAVRADLIEIESDFEINLEPKQCNYHAINENAEWTNLLTLSTQTFLTINK